MTDHIIDLRKTGKNFAILANSRAEGDMVKNLPNCKLNSRFRKELEAVYKYIFNEDLPLEELSFSFLLKYTEGRFDKIFYPNVVRGCVDNESANDPNSLYIRWGDKYRKLLANETKVRNSVTVDFYLGEGDEAEKIDYKIVSYPFNGEKFLDPSLVISFIDDNEDSYSCNFPIKLKQRDDAGEDEVDLSTMLNMVMKRGIAQVLDLVQEGREYKGDLLAETLQISDLEELIVYNVIGYSCGISRKGNDIVKLVLEDETQVWCPYSLINFLKSGDFEATKDNPQILVVAGSYTNLAKNGKEYTNYNVCLSSSKMDVNYVEKYQDRELLSPEEAKDFLNETNKFLSTNYQFPQTFTDRDLEIGVNYPLIGYLNRETKTGNKVYKLNLLNPSNNLPLEVWCPTSLIPTINQKPEISRENPSTFRVIAKKVKGDRTYVDSQIIFAKGALEEAIDLDF